MQIEHFLLMLRCVTLLQDFTNVLVYLHFLHCSKAPRKSESFLEASKEVTVTNITKWFMPPCFPNLCKVHCKIIKISCQHICFIEILFNFLVCTCCPIPVTTDSTARALNDILILHCL